MNRLVFYSVNLSSIFILSTILLIPLMDAHALTRTEIDSIDSKILQNTQKIKDLDLEIEQQNKSIDSKEIEIENKKTELREFKEIATGSLDDQNKLADLENQLNRLERDLRNEKTKLQNLLNEKSDLIVENKSLNDRLEFEPIEQKAYTPFKFKGLYGSVGIANSDLCITMLINNFTSNCPSYDELLSLNLDTSDMTRSGEFKTIDGITQREKPQIENHFRIYDFNDFNIFVDPPSNMRNRIKMITIEENFDTYLMPQDFKKINDTRTIHKDRWIDSRCSVATLNAETWLETIADTIYFMRNDCKGKTTLQTIYNITDTKTEFSIADSSKYKHEEFLNKVKEDCLKEYGKCSDIEYEVKAN